MDVEHTAVFRNAGRQVAVFRKPSSWSRAFAAARAETGPLFLVLWIYAAAAGAVSTGLRVSLLASLTEYAKIIALIAEIGASLGVLGLLISIGIRERPRHPIRRLIEEVLRILRPANSVRALLLIASFLTLQALYVFFKPLIPHFVPFSWDPVLATVDRAVFLGHAPWSVLWPIFGNPAAILVINVVYHLWFFWLVMTVVMVAFAAEHRASNVRFFFAFILTWIVGGTVLATLFSSVGPCYYGFIYPGLDPFKPLLTRLDLINEHVPVFARGVQEMLWDGQMHPAPDKLSGISAMPSMHFATAFLLTRIAFVHDRRLGYVSVFASALIFIGSILLAWHYAVDSVAGGLVAAAAWAVACRVFKRSQA